MEATSAMTKTARQLANSWQYSWAMTKHLQSPPSEFWQVRVIVHLTNGQLHPSSMWSVTCKAKAPVGLRTQALCKAAISKRHSTSFQST